MKSKLEKQIERARSLIDRIIKTEAEENHPALTDNFWKFYSIKDDLGIILLNHAPGKTLVAETPAHPSRQDGKVAHRGEKAAGKAQVTKRKD